VPAFVGRPATPRRVDGAPVPRHPFMAATDPSNMHVDAYASDVHAGPGPLGIDPEVRSTARGRLGGECATVVFDRRGRIVTVCMSRSGPRLALLDPATFGELAGLDLPQRPSMKTWDLRAIVTDTSGGAYFYLDHRDRAVVPTSDRRIQEVATVQRPAGLDLHVERTYDLAPALAAVDHDDDTVPAVLPDWEGRYWFVTRHGVIGTVDPESGAVMTIVLDGEEIQNSFATAPDGVYVVSSHALYRLEADPATGAPRIAWREVYDRGTRRKVGMIHHGSGTTPTLVGDEWVAIADNAEPRVNVLVYRRTAAADRLACRVPVFAPDRSAAENSIIGFGRALVVENNHGYDIFTRMMFGRTATGGVARIDVDADGRGCRLRWESPEISQTVVAKLSLANGLVYLYTKAPDAPRFTDAYYLTAVDFETGATVFKVLTGTGVGYDNHWAPITLGPDGTAYVGVLRGLIAVRDRGAPGRDTASAPARDPG
jgi:hypothetical protein